MFFAIFIFFIFTVNISGFNPDVLKSYTLKCEGKNCHSSITMLVSYDDEKGGFSVCSGFLVDKDIVMTNSHCIPSIYNSQGVSLDQKLIAIFPKTKRYKESKIFGKNIILSYKIDSNPSKSVKDIALIKLEKKVDREILELSNKGFYNNEKIEIFDIDYKPGDFKAFIRRKKCKVIFNSFISPMGRGKKTPHVTIGGCYVKHGNSGAPVLSKKGKVKGVLFSKIDHKQLLKVFKKYLKHQYKPTGMGVAINLACVIPPESNSKKLKPLPKSCYSALNINFSSLISERYEKIVEKYGKKFKKLRSWIKRMKNFSGIKWKTGSHINLREVLYTKSKKGYSLISTLDMKLYVSVKPKCVKNISTLFQGALPMQKMEGYLYKPLYSGLIPLYKLNFKFNKYIQLTNIYPKKSSISGYLLLIFKEETVKRSKFGITDVEVGTIFLDKNFHQITDLQFMKLPFCK